MFRCVCRGEKGIFPGWGKRAHFQLVGGLSPIPSVGKTLEHSVSLNPTASLMEGFIFSDINIKWKNMKSFNKSPSILYKQLTYEDLQQQN